MRLDVLPQAQEDVATYVLYRALAVFNRLLLCSAVQNNLNPPKPIDEKHGCLHHF